MKLNLLFILLSFGLGCCVFSSCEEKENTDIIEPVPVVQTLPVNWTSATTASGGGKIDGQANVTKRGLVWSTNPNPKITDSKLEAGSGNGEFTSTLNELIAGNNYYIRAYAETNSERIYGNEVFLEREPGEEHTCQAIDVHNPSKTYGTMTDQQGNVYKTIIIGTQEWMAENLKTSIYRNGEAIANVIDNNQWAGLTTGAWCYYNNDSQYECPYGKLYNWHAVADPRNVCPNGWHVPTDAEWTTLTTFLGSESAAGGKMKSTGLQYWASPNRSATNESAFSGLPGGSRYYYDGTFDYDGYFGIWWSSTEHVTNLAWSRSLYYLGGSASRNGNSKAYGFSVRCLRD